MNNFDGASELLVYIAYGCAFFGGLIAIVLWRNQYQNNAGGKP